MTTVAEHAEPRPSSRGGAIGWLTTTDHKRIGILYMVTTFGFFLVAGLFSLVMRAELAAPGLQVVDVGTYDELFTIHGTAMIFLFVAPFGIGLANYLLPLQIGAPDMAFPRMNALSYWVFLAGGLLVFAGFGTGTGAADAGWTGYVPLAGSRYAPGPGVDLWLVGLLLASASSIMGAVNFLTTAILLRAPGMTLRGSFRFGACRCRYVIVPACPSASQRSSSAACGLRSSRAMPVAAKPSSAARRLISITGPSFRAASARNWRRH